MINRIDWFRAQHLFGVPPLPLEAAPGGVGREPAEVRRAPVHEDVLLPGMAVKITEEEWSDLEHSERVRDDRLRVEDLRVQHRARGVPAAVQVLSRQPAAVAVERSRRIKTPLTDSEKIGYSDTLASPPSVTLMDYHSIAVDSAMIP